MNPTKNNPLKTLSSPVHFPKLEEEVLAVWKGKNIFQQSLDASRENKPFVFYDGPPFATGTPHYGHLLAGTLKDIVPRYKTMKGFFVERRFGWDCHGLPIEMEMQQELSLKGSADIEAFGVGKFNDACKRNVLQYTSAWERTTLRLGRWIDFDNAYKTMDKKFMESVWWVFAELYKKNLIVEGVKVLPYSWKAATILSNFEANLNYKTKQDPAITVKFRRQNAEHKDEFFLAWTTTPWTLPANLLLCVRADLKYCRLLHKATNEVFVLGEKASKRIFKPEEIRLLDAFLGRELVGAEYEPLFPYSTSANNKTPFRVVADGFVDDEEGVGIVHIAPAYGEDDQRIGDDHGFVGYDPIDADGNFDESATLVKGMNFLEANKTIIRSLKQANQILRHEVVEHSYPYCWRTDTPLMYKAISTLFVRASSLRSELQQSNNEVHWLPNHLKEGRFGNWLKDATDWAVSRNRYWGTPIPIWKNGNGHVVCVGTAEASETTLGDVDAKETKPFLISTTTLERLSGKPITDLHKPGLDAVRFSIKPPTKDCYWGGEYKRISEVLDCWFESGSMPFGQQHFPFDAKDNERKPPKMFPADFIAEGLDQTRGWFYTLMVLSTALYGRSPYRNVVVNGLVLAEDGKKMSKRLKNYPDPDTVMNKHGADALRLYITNSGAAKGDSLRFSEAGVVDMVKSLLLPMWHATSFFTSYARIDGWVPSARRNESPPQNPMDKWVLSRLQNLIIDVEANMDSYALHNVVPILVRFADQLTNTYIRRGRRRFWKSEQDASKNDAYKTLHKTLLTFVKVVAPFAPFLSETLYAALGGTMESVHLESFPKPRLGWVDKKLESNMEHVETILSLGRSLRKKHKLKVRQPLKSITIFSHDDEVLSVVEQHKETLQDELNVKAVFVETDLRRHLDYEVKCNFKTLGKRYGKRVQSINKAVMALGQEDIQSLLASNEFVLRVEGKSITLLEEDLVVRHKTMSQQPLATEGSITCSLDATLTEELLDEGLAREFVHCIQKTRQQMNLNYTDRIDICFRSDDLSEEWLQKYKAYICRETLAQNIQFVDRESVNRTSDEDVLCRSELLNGKGVFYSIRRTEVVGS